MNTGTRNSISSDALQSVESRKLSEKNLPLLPSLPLPPKPVGKKRSAREEETLLRSAHEKGWDREDIQMMRLAFSKLKSQGDELVRGVSWAYYPHDILSLTVLGWGGN